MVSKKTIITIGTTFLIVIFSLSIFLPIFINYSSKIEKSDNNQTNINKFFKDKNVDEKNSSRISIIDKIDKKIILNKLTNFNDNYDCDNLIFVPHLVKSNLLNILKEEIKNKCNISVNSLYAQLRYEILYDKELEIDLRWIDKTNHLFLYYDKNVIKLNNNSEV